jgi:hypothetical protein
VALTVLIVMLPDFATFVGVSETLIINNEVIVSAFVLSSLIFVIIEMLEHGLFLVKLILIKPRDSLGFKVLKFLQAVHLLLGNAGLFDHTTS